MIYSFDIEYRKTSEFGNADGLSRLPDPRELPSSEMVIDEVAEKQMMAETWEEIILNEDQVAKATQEDETLRKVYTYVMRDWPQKIQEKESKPYKRCKTEINAYKGCLMRGSRIVIPHRFRKRVLEILHCSHYGRNRMVALARKKVWYPGIDMDIQKMAQSCEICATMGNDMTRTPLHPWEMPAKVWQRLHMDFGETTDGKRWLIVVDAKSKWPEVLPMSTNDRRETIEKLKDIFSTHGLPEQIVVDNGPQFIAKAFKEYCKRRNIELTFIPPYHHNSNGEAERYRATEHPATGMSPAEMLMGRALRTTLDVFKRRGTRK
ncbi:integrase core domain protein [Cooperia oncophora]